MAEPAIETVNLGKRYRIGARQRDRTFREMLMDGAMAPWRRLRSFGRSSHREADSIWALRGASFQVRPGEVLGVIGKNGAGKSTLLKLIARITEPTEGRGILRGRVACLLEVGTGFHSELTGRENVFLSGAILGMRRSEIRSRFDEIVHFSGVEKFIDTPVKRYSSGMRVRLGFAVAAHLLSEILLIDEVLAVGDAAFRRKCLGKMDEAAHSGRTVLFVSHNMAAISSLCSRALLLTAGRVRVDATPEEAIGAYLEDAGPDGAPVDNVPNPDKPVRLTGVQCLGADGTPCRTFEMGKDMRVRIEFEVLRSVEFGIHFSINDGGGRRVFAAYTEREGLPLKLDVGPHVAELHFPRLLLNEGRYYFSASLWRGRDPALDLVSRFNPAFSFDVLAADMSGTGKLVESRQGVFWMDHSWDIEP